MDVKAGKQSSSRRHTTHIYHSDDENGGGNRSFFLKIHGLHMFGDVEPRGKRYQCRISTRTSLTKPENENGKKDSGFTICALPVLITNNLKRASTSPRAVTHAQAHCAIKSQLRWETKIEYSQNLSGLYKCDSILPAKSCAQTIEIHFSSNECTMILDNRNILLHPNGETKIFLIHTHVRVRARKHIDVVLHTHHRAVRRRAEWTVNSEKRAVDRQLEIVCRVWHGWIVTAKTRNVIMLR